MAELGFLLQGSPFVSHMLLWAPFSIHSLTQTFNSAPLSVCTLFCDWNFNSFLISIAVSGAIQWVLHQT